MAVVKDVMTPEPVCGQADATLSEVARMMAEEDTGFIPIVSKGRLCGVITDRDVVVRAIARGIDPHHALAKHYCSTKLESVLPNTPVEDAIKHMESRQIRRLLVLDGDRLIGVVSLGDLAEFSLHEAEEVLVEVSKSPKTLSHPRPAA